MSVKYIPVQWNPNKWVYDAVMLAGVAAFLWVFLYLTPGALSHEWPINPQIHNARAFGACAFVMLTVILCIGPAARLDKRFLPLLYNRRHFGVMTAFVALTHAGYILNWYFAFSSSDKYVGLLYANSSFGQIAGFPFEIFGIFALVCLLILAATSHDFWLKFLTPPVWKRLHYLIYAAYFSVAAHVSLGILQDQQNHVFTVLFLLGAGAVIVLHLAAWMQERSEAAAKDGAWAEVAHVGDFQEGYAKIAKLATGDRVAVYLMEGKLSAISNACAHQNGPLGEGKIIDCLVTCPWHGFQYDVRNGRSPAPFTEKVPTYRIRVMGDMVEVHPDANPPGTYVEPVALPEPEPDLPEEGATT
ncbi:Rieske 2Fe-2S domain-containing protein [uncultured Tateyamaria sp.]|uniref:Rieske 2Fe-2S domain-containing protein n=1 Tax=uncultured Tateyamaria sp. TaxID=455651 RepID=UPI002633EC1A|nr:Rieske 2Fe-2S domain-containing protein [uncultured Tateyamaria sp.]